MKRILLIMMLFWSCGMVACEDAKTDSYSKNNPDTAVLVKNTELTPAEKQQTNWARLDWNSPIVRYDEIGDTNAHIRGNDQYGIYSLGENILFESGSAVIRKSAEANLKSIAASINQRYNNGEVRIYGYTDSVASEATNNQLSAQRAAAVKDFLSGSGNIAVNRITVIAEGEHHPIASNGTASGRKQNRRVEIVAMKTE